jgi:hypothetical protein
MNHIINGNTIVVVFHFPFPVASLMHTWTWTASRSTSIRTRAGEVSASWRFCTICQGNFAALKMYGIADKLCLYVYYAELPQFRRWQTATSGPWIVKRSEGSSWSRPSRNAKCTKRCWMPCQCWKHCRYVALYTWWYCAKFIYLIMALFFFFFFVFQNYERMNLADALVPKSYSKGEKIITQGNKRWKN